MQFIDLKAQYQHLKDDIDAGVLGVLEHGRFIMGPEVKALEDALSEYTGVTQTVSCASGTDALQLALMALEIGPGDAVFTTPFTFFATAEVISLVGAVPVFVDIDAETYNIDPERLEEAVVDVAAKGELTPRAIIAVDLFGLPADYDALDQIAEAHGLDIIEDAAQGFGGTYHGRQACSLARIGTTSFFPAKPLGCYGDGGAVFTNDANIAEVLRSLRVHGKGTDKYDNVRIGLNSRLDTLQAAILIEKLKAFPQELVDRQRVADRYTSRLSDAIVTPLVPDGLTSSWAQYTVRAPSGQRAAILDSLKAKGIPTAIYYGKSLHEQSAYSDHPHVAFPCPNSEAAAECVFSLPMHPYLADEEADRIADAVRASIELAA